MWCKNIYPEDSSLLREGQASFRLGAAFYRKESRTARDLGILAAAIHKARTGQLRVLDGMTGCGVRPLRYLLEGGANFVWANDADPEIAPLLEHNLSEIKTERIKISHQDTRRLLLECYQRRDYYDLVDLDSFGSPAPYLTAALLATRVGGLIYLTSTDGQTTSGHAPEQSLRLMGVFARSHPAVHEQGLRLLLGSLLQQAGMQGFSVEPVFSYFRSPIYRVMARLVKHPWAAEHLGFLGYCHRCGQFQTVAWRGLSRVSCPACQPGDLTTPCPSSLVLSGPLWLGALHDRAFLTEMLEVAQVWGWTERVKLLTIMQAEAELPPYFYPLGEIGRRGKLDIPERDRLIAALQLQGYQACATHINPQAIKTNAPLVLCVETARQLAMQPTSHSTNN